MVTTYGIITVADFKAFMPIEFTNYTYLVGATTYYLFPDTRIEAWISICERAVRSVSGIAYTSVNATDGAVTCVTLLAKEMCKDFMKFHDIGNHEDRKSEFNASEYIRRHLMMFLQNDMRKVAVSPVDVTDIKFNRWEYYENLGYGGLPTA